MPPTFMKKQFSPSIISVPTVAPAPTSSLLLSFYPDSNFSHVVFGATVAMPSAYESIIKNKFDHMDLNEEFINEEYDDAIMDSDIDLGHLEWEKSNINPIKISRKRKYHYDENNTGDSTNTREKRHSTYQSKIENSNKKRKTSHTQKESYLKIRKQNKNRKRKAYKILRGEIANNKRRKCNIKKIKKNSTN